MYNAIALEEVRRDVLAVVAVAFIGLLLVTLRGLFRIGRLAKYTFERIR